MTQLENELDSRRVNMTLFESVTETQPRENLSEPYEVTEFKKLSKYEQSKQPEFWRQDHIAEYLEDKWEIQLHNRDAIMWLCKYRDENMQPHESQSIDMKLRQFVRFIGEQENIFPALKIDFKKLNLLHFRMEGNQ